MLNTRLAYSDAFASQPRRPDAPRPATKPAAASDGREDPAQRPGKEASSEQATRKAVKDLNKALQGINTGLEISQDDETGWTVVKVIDRETKETIRQFPSEEALAIAHSLDKMKGVLLSQTA